MNAVILLTAMSATGGIFGGHKARTYTYYPAATCATGTCPRAAAAPAPVTYAQPVAPAATVAAPQQVRYTYQSYYSTCPTGNCPKR